MPKLLIAATIGATVRGFLYPFAETLRSRGWKVDGLANGLPQTSGAVAAFDCVWDAPWSRNPLSARNLFLAARHVRRVVEEGGYDIVHAHTPVAAFVTRYALRRGRFRFGRPIVIYTAHGFHFHSRGRAALNLAFQSLEGAAAKWTDYLVVMNREDEDAARKRRLLDDDRIVYMPGIGVDIATLHPDCVPASEVEGLRRELGLANGDPLFSMLANFEPRKRHADAVRALAEAKNRRAHLALAGLGTVPEGLRRLATDLGIAERVHFLGFREDVPVLIRTAAATILPSNREGLSRAILESMALGVPIIGTNVRGVADLIANGCGLMVEVGDIGGLARAMDRVLADEREARAMGARGRESIARYDVRQIIALHLDLYDRALTQPRLTQAAAPASELKADRSAA